MKRLLKNFLMLCTFIFTAESIQCKVESDIDSLVIYDKSIAKNDYDIVTYVKQDIYTGYIPGKHKNLSDKKWYFVIGLFNNGELEKTLSFPGALLIKENEFNTFKPSNLKFIPQEKGGYKELLSVENGWLFKYNLWADIDPDTGKPHLSVDFGKRIPIYTGDDLDTTYQPWGDLDGNIYFKTKESFQKWDSTKETIEKINEADIPQEPSSKTPSYNVESDGYEVTITVGEQELSIPSDTEIEKIDPISIDETRMARPFKGLGSIENPVSKKDYNQINKTAKLAPGKLIVLGKLTDNDDPIEVEGGLSSIDQEDFKQTIKDLVDTFRKSKDVIRELKLKMREKGIKADLKKSWPTKEEIDQLKIALNPGHPESGGVIASNTQTYEIEAKNGQITVGLPYYKWMRDTLNKPGQRLSPSKIKVKHLVNNYAKLIMKDTDLLKETWARFQEIPGQRSWADWLSKNNDPEMVVMFNYLMDLDDDLDDVLKKILGLKIVKAMKAKRIINILKKQTGGAKAPTKKRRKINRVWNPKKSTGKLKRTWPPVK